MPQFICLFLQAYVACPLGIWNIGFVMVCYGAASTVCSLLAGYGAKKIGRVVILIAGKASIHTPQHIYSTGI